MAGGQGGTHLGHLLESHKSNASRLQRRHEQPGRLERPVAGLDLRFLAVIVHQDDAPADAANLFADRIIVLGKGQIVEQVTHDELTALGGWYAKALQLQTVTLGVPTGP